MTLRIFMCACGGRRLSGAGTCCGPLGGNRPDPWTRAVLILDLAQEKGDAWSRSLTMPG